MREALGPSEGLWEGLSTERCHSTDPEVGPGIGLQVDYSDMILGKSESITAGNVLETTGLRSQEESRA